ncbi:3-hexulose-6-phosphate synthase [Pectinatus frisingensis]|uniref:3-hexulose-6-phosphate synthase n=1 Tax=Pectinatus frisingensis TaxID=865 RepID=UPI0018C74B94|nr:3-hexulose-6-phosphate synthase [Pectinatus frisingensis]
MKLQLAIDELNLEQAIIALDKIAAFVDIIEIGTPFIIREGINAIKTIKEKYYNKEILCDAKIMDGGAFESRIIFGAGADYVTILGVTDNSTIKECISEAKKFNRKTVIDLISIKDIVKRVIEIDQMGVDIIAVHTGVDEQALGRTPLDDLQKVKQYVKKSFVAVAGGINSKTINNYIKYDPNIIIVGGGILHSDNIKETAEILYKKIHL